MTTQNLSVVQLMCRETGAMLPVSGLDPLWSTGQAEQQARLKELHRSFDVLCNCVPEGALMHVKHRVKTDHYFLADNPTSALHDAQCAFVTARTRSDDAEVEIPQPVQHFAPYIERSDSEPVTPSKNKAAGSLRHNAMPQLQRLVNTIITNSLNHITFGRYHSFKEFVEKLTSAKRNEQIKTPWNVPFVSLIRYGSKGHDFICGTLPKLDCTDNTIPTGIWIAYSPFNPVKAAGVVSLYDNDYKVTGRLYQPHQAQGPYLIFSTVVAGGAVREAYVLPIVSHKYVFPVHSDAQRDYLLNQLQDLFAKNAKRDNQQHWYVKPLWPEFDDAGEQITADFHRVTKVGDIRTSKAINLQDIERRNVTD